MLEQGSEQGKEQITPSIPSITKGPSKYNRNEHSSKESLKEKSYTQGTKGPKKIPRIIKPLDPALLTIQVGEDSKTPSPKKELKVK